MKTQLFNLKSYTVAIFIWMATLVIGNEQFTGSKEWFTYLIGFSIGFIAQYLYHKKMIENWVVWVGFVIFWIVAFANG